MLKVWWEILNAFNVAMSKATWLKFCKNSADHAISYTVISKGIR